MGFYQKPPTSGRSGLHVYGAVCSWSGPIEKVGLLPAKDISIPGRKEPIKSQGLPCCPYCKGVLFQMDESEWWQGVDAYERKGATNYRAFIEWKERIGKCFRNALQAKEAFEAETGKIVNNA